MARDLAVSKQSDEHSSVHNQKITAHQMRRRQQRRQLNASTRNRQKWFTNVNGSMQPHHIGSLTSESVTAELCSSGSGTSCSSCRGSRATGGCSCGSSGSCSSGGGSGATGS